MPFTPSHAVVALPFARTRLVPAAIAIGAMTPDLPLFVRSIGLTYGFTHTVGNILWTAAIAFALFLLWRVVLRPAVPELAPAWLARRLPEDWTQSGMPALRAAVGAGRGPLAPVWLVLSLALGVLSHIVWDLFTHEGRAGVELFPVLDLAWRPLHGYRWLQYGSSVVGLAIIAIWALRRVRSAVPRQTVRQSLPQAVRIAWWLSLPVMLVTAWVLGLIAYGHFTHDYTVQHLAYRVLPPTCALWGVLTLLLRLSLPFFRRARLSG